MKHLCYYCNQELIKNIVLITFYTKKCVNCQIEYHLDYNHKITLIVLVCNIKNIYYKVLHNLQYNKIQIMADHKEIIRYIGDYNTINPSNLEKKLRTILTFL